MDLCLTELARLTKAEGVVELVEPRIFLERSSPSYTLFADTVAKFPLARAVDVNFAPNHLEDLLVRRPEGGGSGLRLGPGGLVWEMGLQNMELL